jgi:hypothetical protein
MSVSKKQAIRFTTSSAPTRSSGIEIRKVAI